MNECIDEHIDEHIDGGNLGGKHQKDIFYYETPGKEKRNSGFYKRRPERRKQTIVDNGKSGETSHCAVNSVIEMFGGELVIIDDNKSFGSFCENKDCILAF